MNDPSRLLALAEPLLGSAEKAGIDLQVGAIAEDGHFARFARNAIHQSIAQADVTWMLRGVRDGALAEVRTHGADPRALERALAALSELLRHAPKQDGLCRLPEGGAPIAQSRLDARTAACDAEDKARRLTDVFARARAAAAEACGAFVTGRTTIAVASNRGVRATSEATDASIQLVATRGAGSGYAHRSAAALDGLDLGAAAEEAIATARRDDEPHELLPAGDYDVVLAPYAAEPLLEQLASYGLNGRLHADGISFLAGREGEQVASPELTVRDDGLDPERTLPLPFDLDGMPCAPAVLIDRGSLCGSVSDLLTAPRLAGRPHFAGRSCAGTMDLRGSSPFPLHLVMDPGRASVEELVAGVSRGLLVTRLWYVRMQDAPRGLSTGMTRDGTFLIEGGEIARPVRSVRYTQPLAEILSRIDAIGAHGRLLASTRWLGPRLRTTTWTAAARVRGLHITS